MILESGTEYTNVGHNTFLLVLENASAGLTTVEVQQSGLNWVAILSTTDTEHFIEDLELVNCKVRATIPVGSKLAMLGAGANLR